MQNFSFPGPHLRAMKKDVNVLPDQKVRTGLGTEHSTVEEQGLPRRKPNVKLHHIISHP